MPSYIELNKNATTPASSNTDKILLSINNFGQVTTTDSNGERVAVGTGVSLYIPKPIPYSTKGFTQNHSFNQDLSNFGNGSGLPGAYDNSWNPDYLKLTYQSSDFTFLNFNPKYFLFVYQAGKKMGKANSGNPNTRINNEKYGKYFSHPASFTGSYADDGMGGFTPNFTNVSTYSNFSGNTNINDCFGTGVNTIYTSSFSDFTTEWSVATGSGQTTILDGFDPLRFYWTAVNLPSPTLFRGREFFPMLIEGAYDVEISGSEVSVTSRKNYKRMVQPRDAFGVQTYTKPKVDLYIKFAIVIDDPLNAGRYLIGPMSDTIKIFPKEGYFNDDIDTGLTRKYYYTWGWKLV